TCSWKLSPQSLVPDPWRGVNLAASHALFSSVKRPLDPASASVVAANRFGLGARPGELQDIKSDPRGWLERQVRHPAPIPDAIRRRPASETVFKTYLKGVAERRERRAEAESGAQAAKVIDTLRKEIQPIYLDQVATRYRVATQAADAFRERLVQFWTNHF